MLQTGAGSVSPEGPGQAAGRLVQEGNFQDSGDTPVRMSGGLPGPRGNLGLWELPGPSKDHPLHRAHTEGKGHAS